MKVTLRRDVVLAQSAFVLTGLMAVVLAGVGQRDAQAYPKYAKKEGKPCSYCHVKAEGGGKRNDVGTWYGAHGHSFVGFTGGTTAVSSMPAAKPTPKPALSKTKATKAKPAKKSGTPAHKAATPKS